MDKLIKIYRGASIDKITLKNGDMLDSKMIVYDGEGTIIFSSNHINTDPSIKNSDGGILAPGVYRFGIWMWKDKNGKDKYLTPVLYNSMPKDMDDKITTKEQLKMSDRTFLSTKPNANQGGKDTIACVLIHPIGKDSDGSAGCITMPKKEFDTLMSHFKEGDKGCIELIGRTPRRAA